MKTVTRTLQVLMVFLLLLPAFQSSAQTTVTVGNGTVSCNYPYTTYWGGGRSQFLYTAAQLTAAGAIPGTITSMGFNVISNDPYLMNLFNIRMMSTAATTITSWVTGMQTCYSGTYSVPGTGWQMITLQTPFLWNGTSNLILEVCYSNGTNYSNYSYINGTDAPAGQIYPYWMDGSGGCAYTGAQYTGYTGLPNFRFVETPLVTGNLSGTVRNCFNNNTMPAGVSVTCGGKNGLTNGSGVYTLTGINAGAQQVTATYAGFTQYGPMPVTVVGNTTTTYNFCMNPIPGVLSGVITNCSNTNPVVGAKVVWTGTPNIITYSTAGGAYSLNVYPGATASIQISKEGFVLKTINGLTVTPPATLTQNVCLDETTPPPSAPFTAALNAGQTAVNLNWGLPVDDMDLIYDDGIEDNFAIWATGGGLNMNAMKFTPISYPTIIKGFYVNIGQAADYPAGSNPFTPVQMAIYSDAGGLPGTQLSAPTTITPAAGNYGWIKSNFTAPVTLTSGNFFIVMIQLGNSSASPGIAIDTTVQQLRSYSNFGGLMWVPGPGNYMIRAIVNGSGGPLLMSDQPAATITASAVAGLNYEYAPATVTGVEGSPKVYSEMGYSPDILVGYQVWRLLQTQETTPGLWTSLGTPTNTNYVDNGWPSVTPPCGPFRWAVEAQYTFNRWSTAVFSNVIGKCWTCNVTLNVDVSCDSSDATGAVVKFQNLDLIPSGVDTSYTYVMTATGTHTFTNFWKGNYSLTINKFGYTLYTVPTIPIFGDMTINAMLLQIKSPPTGLNVPDSTLHATWFPPSYQVYLLNEPFTSGSFATNSWVPDAGSIWTISATDGNPGQCAEWNYLTGHLTNYDQSLTSKTMVGLYSPVLRFKYDIHLDNYGTTTLEQMAVELYDGATWHQLKNYDNSTGNNIPYTSEDLDISAYTGATFKIRFRAYGADNVNIDFWDVDNVQVIAKTPTIQPNPCIIGYEFYLNGVNDGFTQDTFYDIPPSHVSYGTFYHACVLAIYGSGYSATSCFDFTSHFLCPPNNLAVTPIENVAYLTWEKPNCGGCTLATYQFEAGTLDNGFSAGAGNTYLLGNYFPVTPATTTGVIKSFDIYFCSTSGTTSAQSCILYVYDAAHTLLGQSAPFVNTGAAYPSGTWINVPFADLPYTGSFYGMVDYTISSAPYKNWFGVQYVAPTGYPSGLAYQIFNGTWGLAGPAFGFTPSTFIERANVCVSGKDKDAPLTTIDPGQTPVTQSAPLNPGTVSMGTIASVSTGGTNTVAPNAPAAAPVLLGYHIFRDGHKIANVLDPNTLEYYDNFLNPGTYCYTVNGYYNVNPFNPPTQRDTSQPAGPVCVPISYGYPLPFFEPWTQASFGYQNWTLPVGQLNWSVNTAVGNPIPCADFSWQPAQTNYDLSLVSPAIDASAWTCADIWLDVDVKLIDRNATGNEILDIDIKVNGNWINKLELTNTGSMDWTLQHIDISSVKGKAFNIRFRARGQNSVDMLHWYVDNIHAYGLCKAPTALAGQQNQFTTTLTWTAPDCGHAGPPPQWIHWDDGTNGNSIGYGSGVSYDFAIAARWTPTQIAPLDGGSVTKIAFWPASAGTATFRARIWEGALAANMVVDVPITTFVNDQYNTFTLPTPHVIDISQELWIGLDVNQTDGWPAGCDPGPAIDQYGNWIYDGTSWSTMSLATLNYNWNIQAYVEPSKKEANTTPVILAQTPVNNPKGMNPSASGKKTTGKAFNTGSGLITPNSPMGSQLLGYNVYSTLDNQTTPFHLVNLSGPVTSPYSDVHPNTTEPFTTWKYFVTAVFQDSLHPEHGILCEPSSDTITITFPAVGLNDLTNGSLSLYPNPANEVVNIVSTSDIKTIEVLNYIGQTIYTNNNVNLMKAQLNTTSFKAGVYFVKVTTTSGIKTTKITVTH